MPEKPPDKKQLLGDKFALFIVVVMPAVLIEQNNTNIHCIYRKIRVFLLFIPLWLFYVLTNINIDPISCI
jgi:hypothetical protein